MVRYCITDKGVASRGEKYVCKSSDFKKLRIVRVFTNRRTDMVTSTQFVKLKIFKHMSIYVHL